MDFIQTDPIIFSKCVHKLINHSRRYCSPLFDSYRSQVLPASKLSFFKILSSFIPSLRRVREVVYFVFVCFTLFCVLNVTILSYIVTESAFHATAYAVLLTVFRFLTTESKVHQLPCSCYEKYGNIAGKLDV